LLGQTGAVKLTLSDTGGTVTGTLAVDVIRPNSEANPSLTTAVIPVTGTTADGALRLSGSAVIDQTTFGAETANVTSWTTILTGTTTVGPFQAIVSGYYFGFGYPQTFTISANVQLTKQS
jgi:hypothetical protein